jgi:hypothetical protein
MFFQKKDGAIKPSLNNLLALSHSVFRVLFIQIQKLIAIILFSPNILFLSKNFFLDK